jgi:arylformamidase
MKYLSLMLMTFAMLSTAQAQNVKLDIPYAETKHKLQTLDVFSSVGAKGLPVVVWIHGGGWVTGDKTDVAIKPKAFVEKGFVFVSVNYRMLPEVDMETITSDVAKSVRWVHDHISEYGGDPKRLLIMGHSAGAQLAALICTDESYLKAEGLSLAIVKASVPVDGDTYDIPLMIEVVEARRAAAGKPVGKPYPKNGHYMKFGNDPKKHLNFSAVNHVVKGKYIPPFLCLYVAAHTSTSAQARRLNTTLTDAGFQSQSFGAPDTTHMKLADNLGLPDDPSTKVLYEFLEKALKK